MSVGIIRRCPRREGRREPEISGPTSAVVLVRILRARLADAEPTLDFRVRCRVRPDVEGRPTRSFNVASRVGSDPAMLVAYADHSRLGSPVSQGNPRQRRHYAESARVASATSVTVGVRLSAKHGDLRIPGERAG
jgi:hypothetical protein